MTDNWNDNKTNAVAIICIAVVLSVFFICFSLGLFFTNNVIELSDYQACIGRCPNSAGFMDYQIRIDCMKECQNVPINPCIGIACEEIESFSAQGFSWEGHLNISNCIQVPCDCHEWGCALYCMECE